MKSPGTGMGLVMGALLSAPLLGVLYLASEWVDLPFTPYDIFDRMTRALPGSIVTFGIDVMIDTLRFLGLGISDTAKVAERAIAVIQFLVGGMAISVLYFRLVRDADRHRTLVTGLVVGGLAGVAMAVLSIGIGGSTVNPVIVTLWLTATYMVWGGALSQVYLHLKSRMSKAQQTADTARDASPITRRQFVVKVGASAALITVASTTLGTILSSAGRRELEAELAASVPVQTPANTPTPTNTPSPVAAPTTVPVANGPVVPAPGTRPEQTPLEDFYNVSIRTRPTVIDGATWTLSITGLVANPVSLTLDDIRDDYDPMTHLVTLSCISGRIGSDLIGTTQWTGVSVQDILATVQPGESARYLDISSADGFHEIVDLDLIRSDSRIMLCYAWNDRPLPIGHGFPLRIWIPDRFGMKQPRWIKSIEVTSEYRAGFWVTRGWDEVAQVQATSVIDTVAVDSVYSKGEQTYVPVGGIAFAGAREISKVEVRVNGGPWEEARIKQPLSDTTWVVWRYDWPFSPGDQFFEVRCAEGDGTPQAEKPRGNRPSGARGVHSRRVKL